ncbi:hypothetical protein HYQ44_013043 [Verticillium longisporum]|nr:hypothetical protein HYQ44_013043 [Verticillium longisporum]
MNADPPEYTLVKSSFDWSSVKFAHVPPPLDPPAPPLQTRRSPKMPCIQHVFTDDDDDEETQAAAMLRESRRRKVRDVLARDWQSYRAHAWLQDDLNPVSGTGKDQFSGTSFCGRITWRAFDWLRRSSTSTLSCRRRMLSAWMSLCSTLRPTLSGCRAEAWLDLALT